MKFNKEPKGTLLVTGGTSPLGRALLKRFDSLGFEKVIATTRDSSQKKHTSGNRLLNVFLNLENEEDFEPFVQKYQPSSVLHLGKISNGENWAESIKQNVISARLLSTTAAEYGCKHFVFASSAAVYETNPNKFSIGNNIIAPSNHYGEMKLRVEEALFEVSKPTNMPTTTLRIFNVYGEGMHTSLVNQLRNSSPFARVKLRGLTEFKRDYIEVNQVTEAFEKALNVFEPKNESFDIGTGVGLTNLDLINELSKNHNLFYEVGDEYSSVSVAKTNAASISLGFEAKSLLS